MAFQKLVQCSSCRFTNRFGDKKCIICKEPLPQDESKRTVPEGLRQRERVSENKLQTRRVPRGGAGRPGGSLARPSSRIVPSPSEASTAKTIAWLCCDPLPPIPLGPAPTLNVGRSDTCDLVLPHKEVSRVHGLFKVRGGVGMIVYEDEGSSNGTYVNGKRISSTILKVGDRLSLGPYELEIRSNESMQERVDRDSTDSMELTSMARVNPSAALTGDLREHPVTEILQGIEFNQKSGTLHVWSSDVEGELSFEAGLPRSAHMGELLDDEAVLGMIALKKGSFSVTPEVDDAPSRMQTTLTGLMLEASRRVDEDEILSETDSADELTF